jgi:hypothetical protein
MRSITRPCALALLIAALASAALLAQAVPHEPRPAREQRLQIQVSPSVAFAPSVVRIQALVEPAMENRELEFVVDSDWYYRSSTIELSGASAARAYRVEFPAVPAGTHDVRVVLREANGDVRAILRHRVTLRD